MALSSHAVPGRERDEETGEYRKGYADAEFLEAVEQLNLPTTPDVARRVGCNRRTAYIRLHELQDRGEVSNRKVGGALIWSRNR